MELLDSARCHLEKESLQGHDDDELAAIVKAAIADEFARIRRQLSRQYDELLHELSLARFANAAAWTTRGQPNVPGGPLPAMLSGMGEGEAAAPAGYGRHDYGLWHTYTRSGQSGPSITDFRSLIVITGDNEDLLAGLRMASARWSNIQIVADVETCRRIDDLARKNGLEVVVRAIDTGPFAGSKQGSLPAPVPKASNIPEADEKSFGSQASKADTGVHRPRSEPRAPLPAAPQKPDPTVSQPAPAQERASLQQSPVYKAQRPVAPKQLVPMGHERTPARTPGFTDRGDLVAFSAASNDNDEALAAGIRLAREKFGRDLTLRGDELFKQRAIQVIAKHGIDVTLSDPVLERQRRALARERETTRHGTTQPSFSGRSTGTAHSVADASTSAVEREAARRRTRQPLSQPSIQPKEPTDAIRLPAYRKPSFGSRPPPPLQQAAGGPGLDPAKAYSRFYLRHLRERMLASHHLGRAGREV